MQLTSCRYITSHFPKYVRLHDPNMSVYMIHRGPPACHVAGARDLCQPLCAHMPFVSFPLLGRTCDHCRLGTGSWGPQCFCLLCPYLESPALEQRDPGDTREGSQSPRSSPQWPPWRPGRGTHCAPRPSELFRAEDCPNPFLSPSPSHDPSLSVQRSPPLHAAPSVPSTLPS